VVAAADQRQVHGERAGHGLLLAEVGVAGERRGALLPGRLGSFAADEQKREDNERGAGQNFSGSSTGPISASWRVMANGSVIPAR
jgi:hypothetical protein